VEAEIRRTVRDEKNQSIGKVSKGMARNSIGRHKFREGTTD